MRSLRPCEASESLVVGVVLAAVVAAVAAALGAAPVLAQWPTTCVELNDIVEAHLGNDGNVGIYQRVFGEQAEAACQNDHRDDVRGVFAWAFADGSPSTDTDAPDLAWPTDCVELNDVVEAHLGNDGNVGIYQRVFGAQAEAACRTDHRNDVRGVFAWALLRVTSRHRQRPRRSKPSAPGTFTAAGCGPTARWPVGAMTSLAKPRRRPGPSRL